MPIPSGCRSKLLWAVLFACSGSPEANGPNSDSGAHEVSTREGGPVNPGDEDGGTEVPDVCGDSVCAPSETCWSIPNVLVIGDSVSLFSFPFLGRELGGEARLFHCTGEYGNNGADSAFGLAHLSEWLGDASGLGPKTVLPFDDTGAEYALGSAVTVDFEWDIVQFNHGLWDVAYGVSDETYETHLREYGTRLLATSASPIWVTSTPYYNSPENDLRIQALNQIALTVMEDMNVPVSDADSVVRPRGDALYRGDGLPHLNDEGSQLIAAQMAAGIRAAAAVRPNGCRADCGDCGAE